MSILEQYKETLSNCPNNQCGAGINNFSTTARYDNTDDSVVICLCPKCNVQWYLCRYCSGNYMYVLKNRQAVLAHIKRSHKDRLASLNIHPVRKKRKPPPMNTMQVESITINTSQVSNVASNVDTINCNDNVIANTGCLTINNNINPPLQIEFTGFASDTSSIGHQYFSVDTDDSDDSMEETTNPYKAEFNFKTLDAYKETLASNNSYTSIIFHQYNAKSAHYYANESTEQHSGFKLLLLKVLQ